MSLTDSPSGQRALSPAVRIFFLVLIATSLLSLCYVAVAHLRRWPPIYLSPFSPAAYRYSDLTIYADKFRYFGTREFFTNGFPFTYPAPVSLIYLFFYRAFGTHVIAGFVTVCMICYLLPAIGFGFALHRRGIRGMTAASAVAMLLVTSWPAMLVVDRGNMEIAVFAVLVLGVWCFAKGKGYPAAACFGIAAALKLFPFVYLALFLSRRQYKQLLAGIVSFLVTSVAALALLGPSIVTAYHEISNGLLFFKTSYMSRWNGVENGVDHSIFAFVKANLIFWFGVSPKHDFAKALSIYLVLSALTGTLLYFLRIRKLPIVNQVLLLAIASVYFTAFSGDGTLLHLYPPFAMLVFVALKADAAEREIPHLRAVMICLALLFAEEAFLMRHWQRFEGEFKCLVLGCLFFLGLQYPFGAPLDREDPDQPLRFDPPLTVGAGEPL